MKMFPSRSQYKVEIQESQVENFPGGPVVKNLPCNAGIQFLVKELK